MMNCKLNLLGSQQLTAGQTGDFEIEITVGDRPIAPGGGFLVYPPITTVPHVWSMVRWGIGGCVLRMDDDHQADAWMVMADRFVYAESCAVLIRIVNGLKSMPPGYKFRLVLSDTQVQKFAMRGAWFAMEVDHDGKGHDAYTAPLESVPPEIKDRNCIFDFESEIASIAHVDVMPAEASRLVAVMEAKPDRNAKAYLSVRAEDEFGNCTSLDDDALICESSDPGLKVPGKIPIEPGRPVALRTDNCKVVAPGTYFVRIKAPQSNLQTESSFTSTELPQPVYFGDLHGHSSLSDGLGTGEDYFLHARNTSFCDFVSLTDHNRFDRVIIDLTEKYNEPGRFVTLFGRERSGKHGHRNLYSVRAEVVGDLEDGDLYEGCNRHGNKCLMIPHHMNASTKHHWFAGDFDKHDAEHERLIEVVQNRGSFETEQIGGPVFDGGYGASVQSGLAKGYKFGFVGGSDTHRGQPGGPSHPLGPYYYRWKPLTGITAAQMPELTRDDLWDALWNRRTYVTTGARILLDFTVNGWTMGSTLPECEKAEIYGFVAAAGELAGVDIVRDGGVCKSFDGNGERLMRVNFTDSPSGGYYYLRARQIDGHTAYSSPVWIT